MAPPPDDPRNPFESFRRFADDQMSALMRNITGNPPSNRKGTASESSESDEDVPWIIRAMSDEARRRYRETFPKPKDISASENSAAYQEEQLRCPYRPADQAVPSTRRESESSQMRTVDPSTYDFSRVKTAMFDPEDSLDSHDTFTWPIWYLFTSSYSPLYLEQQFPCRDQEERWRHAFEDLIAVQSGMDMTNHNSPQSKVCANHWIGSLMNRGMFRAPLPDKDACGAAEMPSAAAFPPEVGLRIMRLLRAQGAEEMLRELCEASDEDSTEVNEVSTIVCPGINRLMQADPQKEEQPDPSGETYGKYEGHKIPIASDLFGGVMRLLRAQGLDERLRETRKEVEEDEDQEEGDDEGVYDFDDDDVDDDDVDDDHYDDDDHVDEDEYADKEEAATELDLYERWLGLCDDLTGKGLIQQTASRAFKQESSFTGSSSSTTEAADGKPSIISTLTTTERITHPDGSVHTKMVLKKRFADGREESTETTHTTKDQQAKPLQKISPKPEESNLETAAETVNSNTKTKGWFWS